MNKYARDHDVNDLAMEVLENIADWHLDGIIIAGGAVKDVCVRLGCQWNLKRQWQGLDIMKPEKH